LAGASPRTARVASILREVLADQLARGIKDPRVLGVTLVDVEVTGDLREARVFVSVAGDERAERAALEGLRSASGYLRRIVGEQVSMRVTPSLSFRVDRSFEAGARIDAALARLGLGGEAPTAATQVADEGDDDDV